jgi:hypothetical protein
LEDRVSIEVRLRGDISAHLDTGLEPVQPAAAGSSA